MPQASIDDAHRQLSGRFPAPRGSRNDFLSLRIPLPRRQTLSGSRKAELRSTPSQSSPWPLSASCLCSADVFQGPNQMLPCFLCKLLGGLWKFPEPSCFL